MKRLTLALVTAALVAGLVAGCGAARQTPHGGSSQPDAAIRDAVVSALKADGIEAGTGSKLVMTYSADRQTIAVNGEMSRPGQEASAPAVAAVLVEKKSGTWVVVK